MGFESPKPMPSPEEMAMLEKQRTLSDAELIKGGAEYKFDAKGNKKLELTKEQVADAKKEIIINKATKESGDGNRLILPSDKASQEKLMKKLAEYEGRIGSYKAPEQQMDSICKKTILDRLYLDGKVDKAQLAEEMRKQYGSGFNERIFLSAWGVIEDYIKTGGRNVRGGTGLS